MKNLALFLCLFFFIAGINQSGMAQKKVEQVHHLYDLDAYHLTIDKIKQLKPKYQSLRDIQFILADCYWNIDEREKSISTYQNVALYLGVPAAFKDKYERAMQKETPVVVREEPVEVFTEKGIPEAALVENQIVEPQVETQRSIPVKLATVDQEKTYPKKGVESLPAPPPVSVKTGDYRIRVGATTNLADFNLSKIEALGAVEVKEWGNKKIVFTGYYESPELAQTYIDQYLKEEYKDAVVVVKKDGRYRSVSH